MASRSHMLSVIVLFCLSAAVNSLTCPDGYRPYSCTSVSCGCQRSSGDGDTEDFAGARAACQQDGGDLVLVRTSTELQVLRRYLEVVGAGEYFWTGYHYDQGQFVGVDGEGAPSVVTDNIGSSSGASEDDLCLALGSDGMFRNDSCSSSMLRYICLVEYAALAPSTTITPQTGNLQAGTSVTFNCSIVASGPTDLLLRVQLAGSEEFETLLEVNDVSGAETLSYEVEFDANRVGGYECVASNPIGTALSQIYNLDIGTDLSSSPPVINTFDLSYGNESGLNNSEIRTVPFGEEITVSCGFTSGASASWYVNGQKMEATSGDAQSSTLTTVLEVGGVYQCRVADNSTGLSAVESFTLFGGADGTPGPIRFITAFASTQTSLQVMWFQPQVLGVNDPVLLRYQLAYNTADTFKFDDDTTWLLSSEVLPSTDESGLTTHNLGSITSGVKYSIVILARSSTGDISTPRYVASAVTFGQVPTNDIQNLVVNRSVDSSTIVAFWDPITTELPFQPVHSYQFQYRDVATTGGTDELPFSNSGAVAGGFSYAVIPNVKNADEYEFRVRAVYEISDAPDYEYSKWTAWSKVEGVTPTVPPVPPVPPTGGVDGNDDDDDVDSEVIAAAVVGPVLLVLLVVAIILAAVYLTASSRQEKKTIVKGDQEMQGRDAQEFTPAFVLDWDEKPH